MVGFYFLALFAVYAFGDVHRSQAAILRSTRMQPLLPGMALEYRDSHTAAVLLGFRGLLDVLVPLLYGLVGLAVLVEPIRLFPLPDSTILDSTILLP